MKLPQTSRRALTVMECVVVVALVALAALLAIAALPNIIREPGSSQMIKSGSNAAALAKSWIRMTMDYEQQPDVHVGWPGDLANGPGPGRITTAKDFYRRLV